MLRTITVTRRRARLAVLMPSAIAAAALVACGGDGGEETPPAPPTRLAGVAAIGSPLAGATIVVSDADAGTADTAPVTADAQGRYTVDVSALKAPLFVRARATVDGQTVEHAAVVASVAAGADNVANVTPFTSAIASLVAPGGDMMVLAGAAALGTAAAQAGNATQLVVNTLRSDAETASLLGAGFDPLKTTFAADGTGIDAALHRVQVHLHGNAGVTLANLAAPVSERGLAAPATLTAAQVANPGGAPVLAASVAAGNLPTPAELAALGAKLAACFALPVAERVTLDAQGNATAVLGACNFAPPMWRSNGRSFVEDVGQFTLSKANLAGAKVGTAGIVATLAPEGIADPKAFKHPQCNDGPCVVVRFPLLAAGGRLLASDWVLGKLDSAWNFVGNQRPYRVGLETRLQRRVNMNRDGPAPGNTSDPFFFKDRFESLLRLVFDPSIGDTADIRAVRFSGPGLPAAGVVMVRSQRCSTGDRMAIINQVGTTRVIGGSQNGLLQFWTGGSSQDFVLGTANLDGTPLVMPRPANTPTSASFQDFTPTPEVKPSVAVPSWARYRVELFRFSSASDEPDEVLYPRIAQGAEEPETGASLAWPELDPGYASARLTPGGSLAAAITSFADSIAWTIDPKYFVTGGYLFSQNFASATNAQNETATYGLRGSISHEPATFGDTTAAGWRITEPAAGTSLSPSTANAGSNPNPRCGAPELAALTANTSDYREAGLTVWNSERRSRTAIWFWDN